MKIVAVTACITGIAHTYMAQAALEKESKKRGYEILVETQGGMGVENEINQEEVDEADFAILAIAVGIEGEERFDEKRESGKLLEVDPSEVIKNPEVIFDKLEKLS